MNNIDFLEKYSVIQLVLHDKWVAGLAEERIFMRQLRHSIFSFPALHASQFYSSHNKLIDRMKALGYPPSDGFCHGVACLAAQYHLSGNIKTFDHHIKFTQKYARFNDTHPEETRRFFDDIVIGQEPHTFPLIQNIAPVFKNNQTQNTITALSAITDKEIKKYRGIKRLAYFSGAYTMFELCDYFDLLTKSASHHLCTFALLIGSPIHSIMIGFDAVKSQWIFVDANQLPLKSFKHNHPECLAVETHRALSSSRSEHTVFSTQLLTTRHGESQANDFIAYLQQDKQWRKLHSVSKQKATMSDGFYNTWLMEACAIESEFKVIKSLIEQGANLTQTNTVGYSALGCAISYGNSEITRLLLQNGVNPNHFQNHYLCLAAKFGFYDIAKILLMHGAKINPGYPSPIFIAASKGNQKMMSLFKQHGSGAGNSLDRFFSQKRGNTNHGISDSKNHTTNTLSFKPL